MIGVAAEAGGRPPQRVGINGGRGRASPERPRENPRLYSDADLERLRLIQRLTSELGLNLAGVEVVIRLEDELRKAHERIERLHKQLREEVQNVHKQYRRELVLYEPPRPVPTRQH